MSKIVISGNFAQLQEEKDFEFLSSLDDYLSFKVPGAEHTRAFKGFVDKTGKFQRWDGVRKILTNSLTFGTGLVPRVSDYYLDHGRELTIEDNSTPVTPDKPIDIALLLIKLNKDPYPYQAEALQESLKHKRGIIKLATGGGKSLIAALIAAQHGKKTIIYVIGKDLLYQFYDLFKSIFGDRAGIVGDGQCRIGDFNICSIWTVGQAMGLKKNEILLEGDDTEKALGVDRYADIIGMIKQTKLHIIDECHMAACETIQKLYKHIDRAEYIYGLSGSPWRDDNADLLIEAILGKYIVDVPASYLIEKGFLAKPIIRFMSVPELLEKPENNYNSVYKKYIVENPVRNDMVLKAAKALTDQGFQTLILFNSLSHGKILHDLIKDEIPCAMLDGSDNQETREATKQMLLNGKINCVLASKIFDIGVDIPSLSGLIVACGGKSTVKAIQRVGRVIRRYPGKDYAAIIDFADNSKFLDKHSKIRCKIYKSEDGFEVRWPKKKK